jgi:hypothetical protein
MVHSASWQQAWGHTAEVTARMTGFNTGIGVIWNLVALVVWTVDCLTGWPAGTSAGDLLVSCSPRWRRWVEIYLTFLWFQAAVVFAAPAARAAMGLLSLGVAAAIVASRRRTG